MSKKLAIVFNTSEGRKFTLNLNAPKAGLTTEDVMEEAGKIIASGSLTPTQGKPVSVASAKIVEQHEEILV